LALDAENLDNFNSGPGRLFSPQANALRRTQEPRRTPRIEPVNILSGRNSEKRDEEIKSMKALLEEQKRRLKDMNGSRSHRLDGQSVFSQASEVKSKAAASAVLSQGSLQSTLSRLPEMPPGQLMNLAHQLYSHRQELV
jgi:hypothetical protein